jgi:riboflavin kinase/FMN adenylyltransferase
MRILRSLQDIPGDLGSTVVTVGNFDGVHFGHQQVINEVVRRARETGSKAVAVTFDPHPLRVLRPDVAPKLITPEPIKEQLLSRCGLDLLLVLPFTRDFSMLTSHDFAAEILANKLRAKEVHEGENFHFGHKAQGNTAQLKELGSELGFAVVNYPLLMLRGSPASSSQVRELIAAGNVSRARNLLSRAFSIVSTAGRGRGYGHKYTVPTINLSRYDELVPGNGVYLTRTRVGDETFNSVTNVGNRPTFGADSFAIETHLLDFHPVELTAQTEVEIAFMRWLRPEIKFPSVDALKEQIGKDVKKAQRYFRLAKLQTTKDTK